MAYLQNNLWLLGKCNGTGIHKTALMASISISWYSTPGSSKSSWQDPEDRERDMAALPNCHDEWVFAHETRTHVVVIWISLSRAAPSLSALTNQMSSVWNINFLINYVPFTLTYGCLTATLIIKSYGCVWHICIHFCGRFCVCYLWSRSKLC